jgi:hypothetical protein
VVEEPATDGDSDHTDSEATVDTCELAVTRYKLLRHIPDFQSPLHVVLKICAFILIPHARCKWCVVHYMTCMCTVHLIGYLISKQLWEHADLVCVFTNYTMMKINIY